jgi:hypothetical protein
MARISDFSAAPKAPTTLALSVDGNLRAHHDMYLSDVLLGDEITMMGGDVGNWAKSNNNNNNSTKNSATNQMTTPAQPFIPNNSSVSDATASLFSAPPSLVRHASLPTSMLRTPSCDLGPPPSPLAVIRQRSHGFFMQEFPPMNHPFMKLHTPSTNNISGTSIEPMPYAPTNDNKSNMNQGFDLEPIMFGTSNNNNVSSNRNNHNTNPNDTSTLTGTAKIAPEFQQIEKAFESLDQLIPEMDQELFHPAEVKAAQVASSKNTSLPLSPVVPPQHQSMSHLASALNQLNIPLISTTNVTMTPRPMSRGNLSFAMSPHMKNPPLHQMTMHMNMNMGALSIPKPNKTLATCKIGGCERRVRSKGFCKTHGGGRKCSIPGCKKSSQNGTFCIGHGGGKKCKEEGCAKAAQSHGLCKAHGGGARCKFPNCTKSSQGGGLCRAHGGGKRCQAAGCPKGAQRGNFCATHGGFRNCKIEGCVRTDRGGGFCEVHRRGRLCKIEGCKKLSRNQGMCTMHIRQDKQNDLATTSENEATTTTTALQMHSVSVSLT